MDYQEHKGKLGGTMNSLEEYINESGLELTVTLAIPGGIKSSERVIVTSGFMKKVSTQKDAIDIIATFNANCAVLRAFDDIKKQLTKSVAWKYSNEDKDMITKEALAPLSISSYGYMSDGEYVLSTFSNIPYNYKLKSYDTPNGIEVHPDLFAAVDVDGKKAFYYMRQGFTFIKGDLKDNESVVSFDTINDIISNLPFPARIVCHPSFDEIPPHKLMYCNSKEDWEM